MIWSVSTLLRRNGTAVPVCTVNASMEIVLTFSSCPGFIRLGAERAGTTYGLKVGWAGEVAGDRRGGGHQRRDEVRATTLALTSFEVAVGRRGAALARG